MTCLHFLSFNNKQTFPERLHVDVTSRGNVLRCAACLCLVNVEGDFLNLNILYILAMRLIRLLGQQPVTKVWRAD